MSRYAAHLYQQVILFDASTVIRVERALGSGMYAKEVKASLRGDGTQRIDAVEHSLTVTTYDAVALAQMRLWEAAQTSVRAIAFGPDRTLQWLEGVPGYLVPGPDSPGAPVAEVFRLSSAKRTAKIYSARNNLLARYLWTASALPSDLTPSSATLGAVAGGFSMTVAASTLGTARIDTPCPLEAGQSVQAQVDVVSHTFDLVGGDTLSLTLQALNSAGSVVGSGLVSINGTGVVSVTLVCPASTYTLRWLLSGQNDGASPVMVTLRAPTLRIGTGVPVLY